MPPILEFTDAADVHVDTLVFAAVAPGVPGDWQDLRIWNDRLALGADTARTPRLYALAKPRGASVPFEASGVPVLTYRAIEVDVVGSGVRSLGVAADIVLPDISPETFLAIRIRVRAPSGFTLAAADVQLSFDDDPYQDLGNAAPSPGGLDFGQAYSQLFEGGAVTETGSPSTSVTVAGGAAQVDGRIRGWATADYALGSLDGDAVALASGETYGALVTVGLGGPHVVKGSKVTGSPAPADFPLVPLGEVLLAKAIQAFGANVLTADITDLRVVGGFAVSAPGGLGLRVGPGIGIIGRRRVRSDVVTDFTAAASVTDAVLWRNEQRELVSTDGTPLEPGEALCRYSTDGSAVIATEDLRRVAGPWLSASIALPGLVTGEWAQAQLPSGGVEICPLRGVLVGVGDDPVTLGGTSGAWEVEIELWLSGAWATIYPDGAPSIAFDAALTWIAPTPQVLHFEAPMIRARLVTLPAGGSLAPIGVTIRYRAAYAG